MLKVSEITIGQRVKLLGLPNWLIHDLPESEQAEMQQFIGQSAIVCDIDAHGYFWLGFGDTVFIGGDDASYSGHLFGVAREFIEPCHKTE